jgi:hypothetical protein
MPRKTAMRSNRPVLNSRTGRGTWRRQATCWESRRYASPAVLLSAGAIEDDRIGRPGEMLNRIFPPFFTIEDLNKSPGSDTVYRVVHVRGGHIDTKSVPGAGKQFNVRLPAVHPRNEVKTPRP